MDHSGGGSVRVPLTPHRAVGEVARDVVAAVGRLGGAVRINPTPQEVPWTVPLDEDDEHATYDPVQVADYFAAATRAALVLARFRAPYRGRSTAVLAWWGAFDLAVDLFSGASAEPTSDGFILRNSGDAQQVAVGWWPGDARHPTAAFYAYAHPAPGAVPARRPVAGPLGRRAGGVPPRIGRRPHCVRSGGRGPGLRPPGLPARVRRLRLGRRTGGERRGPATSGPLSRRPTH